MTHTNDLQTSASATVARSNVVDLQAYAASRRPPQSVQEPSVRQNGHALAAPASAQLQDTEVLIEAMRALAVARARLDRLSREADECCRKLESIKLG